MSEEHERWMGMAIEVAALARGTTGDNPWVGCTIVSASGELLGRGHTQGPGEDHAEIAAARQAQAAGHSVVGATLYSTLEPCSFHGRTPACAKSIAERGIARVVIGMRDPHPNVDGEGIKILKLAGVEVVEGVCEAEVRRQLGAWVLERHPYDADRRGRAFADRERLPRLAAMYGVEPARVEAALDRSMISAMARNISPKAIGEALARGRRRQAFEITSQVSTTLRQRTVAEAKTLGLRGYLEVFDGGIRGIVEGGARDIDDFFEWWEQNAPAGSSVPAVIEITEEDAQELSLFEEHEPAE